MATWGGPSANSSSLASTRTSEWRWHGGRTEMTRRFHLTRSGPPETARRTSSGSAGWELCLGHLSLFPLLPAATARLGRPKRRGPGASFRRSCRCARSPLTRGARGRQAEGAAEATEADTCQEAEGLGHEDATFGCQGGCAGEAGERHRRLLLTRLWVVTVAYVRYAQFPSPLWHSY